MNDYSKVGWIPNIAEHTLARSQGRKSCMDALHEISAPWDATDTPVITDWSSFSTSIVKKVQDCDYLREIGLLKNWWEVPEYKEGLLIDSQGWVGSCAGVSYYDRCYQTTLLQQIAAGSEQIIESVNALVTWLISKDGSRSGGQSIGAVVKYGIEAGVYPSALVGEYDAGARYDAGWRKFDHEAIRRQMGACLLEDSNGRSMNAGDMTEAIFNACRAALSVEIGQSVGVRSGRRKDENGVEVVELGGSWSHATAFSGCKIVNNKPYVYWINSHGRIYPASDGSPPIGGWMDKDTVRSFCSSAFCDAAIVTYVEAPHGADVVNLNPIGVE